jgi:hypothetical protein
MRGRYMVTVNTASKDDLAACLGTNGARYTGGSLISTHAGVVKLADARDSKSRGAHTP